MFTGLIEEVGRVQAVETTAAGSRMTIEAGVVLTDAEPGASIAIDGVCTTVVEMTERSFTIEASPETLSKTVFGEYQPGRRVNLERTLTPTTRIGGHFVTGHVDGTATVLEKFEEGNSRVFRFVLNDKTLAAYLIPKGSVAVNGISLTVNRVEDAEFTVAIIPHTLAHTSIGDVNPGDTVNIETDLLGKYVHRLLASGNLRTADISAMIGHPAQSEGRS